MVIDSIADDLESHGLDVEVATDIYIVIFNAQDWVQDVAHDILDSYVRRGKIDNYFFDNPKDGGLIGYGPNDLGVLVNY